jgi:hypothetical protein
VPNVAVHLTTRELQMYTALASNRFPDAHETLQELIRLETTLIKPDTSPTELANLEFWRDYLWNRMKTDVQAMVQARLKAEAMVIVPQEIELDHSPPRSQHATNLQLEDCREVLMPELAALRSEIEALRQQLASLT